MTEQPLSTPPVPGYLHGPGASVEATREALEKLDDAHTVVLVEGISDQIAIGTLAVRRGRNFEDEGVVVLPIGGSGSVSAHLSALGPGGDDVRLLGMCDSDAVGAFRSGLNDSGVGTPRTIADMEGLGFYVCVEDLEDELIRAVGAGNVEAVLETHGDLGSFRTLQKQPQWRGRPIEEQLHRFFRSIARRNLRYARILVEVVDADCAPPPLRALVDRI
jgi:hypothetical protein